MSDNAAILDELFGAYRNLPMAQRGQTTTNYWSDDVCKHNLVSICFNELWKHTRYDSHGECTKRHDQYLIKAFQQDQGIKKLMRERTYICDAIAYIQDKIKEVDKIFKRHEQNLESKENLKIDRPKEIQDRLENFRNQQKKLLDESERLGELGKLEESERLQIDAENCKKAAEEYLMAYESTLNPYKTCRVCDICGAKQALQETDRKQQTHLEGKIHQGFASIRAELIKLNNRKAFVEDLIKQETENEKKLAKSERSRSRRKSKEKRNSPSRKSDKSKKDRNKKNRQKSRSRSNKRENDQNNKKEIKKIERENKKKEKDKSRSDKKKKNKNRDSSPDNNNKNI